MRFDKHSPGLDITSIPTIMFFFSFSEINYVYKIKEKMTVLQTK